jgi:hypothetical protein
MKIASHQPDTFIEFKALPELSASSFEITACLSGRKVTYGDIALLRTDQFLEDLQRVLTVGSGEATLEGAYDFRLTVRPQKDRRSTLSFYIAEYIAVPEKPEHDFMRLSLQGSFPISSDVTEHMVDDFKGILA